MKERKRFRFKCDVQIVVLHLVNLLSNDMIYPISATILSMTPNGCIDTRWAFTLHFMNSITKCIIWKFSCSLAFDSNDACCRVKKRQIFRANPSLKVVFLGVCVCVCMCMLAYSNAFSIFSLHSQAVKSSCTSISFFFFLF